MTGGQAAVKILGKTGAVRNWALAAVAIVATVTGASGCGDSPSQSPSGNPIPIGLLLSYSGALAANSINSERALLMAVEAANQAGGVEGRPVSLMMRDAGSDPARATPVARELLEGGATLFIGPDTTPMAVQLKDLWGDRTVILPSFSTSDFTNYKPNSWFVMGAGPVRVACELQAQLRADNRLSPVVLVDSTGYNYLVGRALAYTHGLPQVFLPSDQFSNQTVNPILASNADAYVLAALPTSASSLLYTMAAIGALDPPAKWYLSPTLHTPAFLETIPKGMLQGAHGVATSTNAGTADFRARFSQRWQDVPLDDAYAFYDAGAVAILALQRALVREGTIPSGTGLSPHIVAVTQATGTRLQWNEIERGLTLLRQGQEVGYVGLSGTLQFDASGKTAAANTSWWTIDQAGFVEIPSNSTCR